MASLPHNAEICVIGKKFPTAKVSSFSKICSAK